VRFRFTDKDLEALFSQEKNARRYPLAVVDAFFVVMTTLRAAPDVRELYKRHGLHFEKLKGDRLGEYSMRLNEQYRLIATVEEDAQGAIIVIHDIVDYH
jgi:proteic killer suppression protein